MLKVMLETRGRGAGSTVVNGVVREMRNAYLYEATRNWRAGCIERCKPRFGEGRTEKVWQQNLAGRLLYNILMAGAPPSGAKHSAGSVRLRSPQL